MKKKYEEPTVLLLDYVVEDVLMSSPFAGYGNGFEDVTDDWYW